MALGKAIAEHIEDPGTRPKTLSLLPGTNLIGTSARYFHQKSGLDYHYMLADKNILGLSEKTNVLLAQFKTPARATGKDTPKAQALLVEYPTVRDAAKAYAVFMKAYLHDAKGDAAVKTENGKFAAARQKAQYVLAVFDAPDPGYAGALINAITGKIEVKPK